MPELPEVETVRRMLAAHVPGKRVATAAVSRHRLRTQSLAALPKQLEGRAFAEPRRTGKFLFLDLDGGMTLLSHLGMSGRWLFSPAGVDALDEAMPHVHLRLTFEDRSRLWYQDIRRFGMLRVVPLDRLAKDPSVKLLGPDPLEQPPTAESLRACAKGSRVAVKTFLLDQRKLAGIGNIYASEILFRAAIDPRRAAGALSLAEWARVAPEIGAVLGDAVARMGTTFSTYRTIWNEPGQYGEQLLVYDRPGQPCRRCGGEVKRFVQGGRATFWCPACQRGRGNTRKHAQS
ncbi:MAG: bifunctional DNA-formamidopyrimidine glycosylase/DNA-(apurinic or apyrimidinic site) lyase [Candidatus Eisenbacteria bacterium]|uniref:Bifunctional DNA-formamidopyrimidine glycosylase/DNA-(Apurinic or apyrimidinic site) lyase n=1 Tax=Eiseniibacteriota bacterium TaxID=2212470 RepID=A0A933SH13_UNCEI|nr:bifunctional DNA-formamidopyrimidine glycosylase/DNA-(apurinic or apyrimidinic site) lyase [Candidatus Eisenbacteria bacterium]